MISSANFPASPSKAEVLAQKAKIKELEILRQQQAIDIKRIYDEDLRKRQQLEAETEENEKLLKSLREME